ncbi:hypothetical protein FRB90_003184 [Tulasnella sp. 427]|nr:hypothetical protein FRB90_003184 [Tulasnella sp. 427]
MNATPAPPAPSPVPASIPATSTPSTSGSSGRPPGLTSEKPSLKATLRTFKAAAALQAARRRDNENPRNDACSGYLNLERPKAQAKFYKPGTAGCILIQAKPFRLISFQETGGEARRLPGHFGPSDTLSQLSEAGLAQKVLLSPSFTPDEINSRIKDALPDIFKAPFLSPSLADPEPDVSLDRPWCLLLGREVTEEGVTTKFLRPSINPGPVTFDAINQSCSGITQFRIAGGSGAWKRVIWIALGPHFPNIVLPTAETPDFSLTWKTQYSDEEEEAEEEGEEDDPENGTGDEQFMESRRLGTGFRV